MRARRRAPRPAVSVFAGGRLEVEVGFKEALDEHVDSGHTGDDEAEARFENSPVHANRDGKVVGARGLVGETEDAEGVDEGYHAGD